MGLFLFTSILLLLLTGFSGGAATGVGNQGLEALGSSGLAALQSLGGLSSLLGNIGGNVGGGALGQGPAYDGGGMSGSSNFGYGSGGASDAKIGSGSGRDDSGRQIFVRNVSIRRCHGNCLFVGCCLLFVFL